MAKQKLDKETRKAIGDAGKMMEEWLDELPAEPLLAGRLICRAFQEFDLNASGQRPLPGEAYDAYLGFLGLLQGFTETHRELRVEIPAIIADDSKHVSRIREAFATFRDKVERALAKQKIERASMQYKIRFGSEFSYEVADGDLQRIQVLINELRDIISETEELQEGHKSRLLRRLEKLQAELHEKVSDLDRLWGFLIELSIVAGTCGENAKPILDRVREIASVIWPVQTGAWGLPAPTPFPQLTAGGEEDSADDSNA